MRCYNARAQGTLPYDTTPTTTMTTTATTTTAAHSEGPKWSAETK